MAKPLSKATLDPPHCHRPEKPLKLVTSLMCYSLDQSFLSLSKYVKHYL